MEKASVAGLCHGAGKSPVKAKVISLPFTEATHAIIIITYLSFHHLHFKELKSGISEYNH